MDHLADFKDDRNLKMIWLYYILLLLIAIGGLVLAAFTLPGLWVMTGASAIYALITHERHLGAKSLITLFLLSFIAEVLELTLGGAAAKRAGGGYEPELVDLFLTNAEKLLAGLNGPVDRATTWRWSQSRIPCSTKRRARKHI